MNLNLLVHPLEFVFSVKSLRMIIENVTNSPFTGLCFWNKWLPPRINCLVWRLLLKRMPIRSNLCARGINISFDLCPICENSAETVWNMSSCRVPSLRIYGNGFWTGAIFEWSKAVLRNIFFLVCLDQGKTNKQKGFLEAAFGCVLWFVWKARNNLVFNGKRYSGLLVMDEVQASLFAWIKYRSKCSSLPWSMWCCNPLPLF